MREGPGMRLSFEMMEMLPGIYAGGIELDYALKIILPALVKLNIFKVNLILTSKSISLTLFISHLLS